MLYDVAKYYSSKGFSVIPLSPKGKKPLVPWIEYQGRKPTEEELKTWFNGTNNNIGIVTGAISGVVVVDMDSEEAYALAEEKGLPYTPMVKTGHGYHAYFEYREARNFQKRDDLRGIDFRADGGYVVAPPSVHPSGETYEWMTKLEEASLATLPLWVLTPEPGSKTPLKELYKGVPEGMRNDSLARITGSLASDGLSLEECRGLADAWNSSNKPPLPETEVERTVRSIFTRHHAQLGGVGVEDAPKTVIDPCSFLKKGSELMKMDCHIEWLIDGLLPKGSITVFHGRGGIGKTWLSLILADAIAEGKPFMCIQTEKAPVVYIDFENSKAVLIERLRKVGGAGVEFWHCSFDVPPPRLDSRDWERYKQMPPGALLIIDSFRAGQRGDENDSRSMASIMGQLKELRDMGFTVVLLHHTPKSDETVHKGSTAILDMADHMLSLYKVGRNRYSGDKYDEENEDDGNATYRFGVKSKTRYEPNHIFLKFDPEKGFVPASDPDSEILERIAHWLETEGRLNTNGLFDLVKDKLGIRSKGKYMSLMKKGIGKYWRKEKGEGGAVYYIPIPSSNEVMEVSDSPAEETE